MAPQRNNDRHSSHTGTIPKSKVRNNCNVPQEAVTPTRRELSSNLVTTSLDWVPVSEYNSQPRSTYNQSRKQSNNTSDHELNELDQSASFEGGLGRFVPVRPQPRVIPLSTQNRDSLSAEHSEDNAASALGHNNHQYPQSMHNGLIPHSNHAAAAVMIVNPTTPNTLSGNLPQQLNGSTTQNRNNLMRNLNPARNNFDNNSNSSNNLIQSNSRNATKTVNLINDMYDATQGSSSNINDNHSHRESARALGEAIVASCPDATAVERRLGQIREYIRVTSSLVDTMRNSEDEAYIEHTKEEYDELVEMVMKLKESETKLVDMLADKAPDNVEVPAEEEPESTDAVVEQDVVEDVVVRPMSVQSNGSVYSDNELWQNEIKNKMEVSQQRLTTLKQQQKLLLKYQAEAKQQLDEMSRAQQSHELQASASHDNLAHVQHGMPSGSQQRLCPANQPPPHAAADDVEQQDSEPEEDGLSARGRQLARRLRDLQLKKQHMEDMVSEFQKLQAATALGAADTYSSSGDDSDPPPPARPAPPPRNDDPFKLMEIKAIKAALEKTKDLMRTVENYETDLSAAHEDAYATPHSNMHDNKSEGGGSAGGSAGGWSTESAGRVRNKCTNAHNSRRAHEQSRASQEANLASLQDLAQELRMETEKIMGERARLQEMVASKEYTRKQKKVNATPPPPPPETRGPAPGAVVGPAERRQAELRAVLAEKQRQLEELLNKAKLRPSSSDAPQNTKLPSCSASLVNHSYNSEQEEPDSRSDHMLLDVQGSRDGEAFRQRGAGGARSLNTPSHAGSVYASDSDTGSRREKCNQRGRGRKQRAPERAAERPERRPIAPDDHAAAYSPGASHMSLPGREDALGPPPPLVADSPPHMPYPPPPPSWGTNKSNQDMRANQFTQNSHSQTMDRLLGSPHAPPHVAFPPSVPFNMMMPYGMVGNCGCGCAALASWCWQQMAAQQRAVHALREQLTSLEERWRAESASHTLNNQVPPGNRANNYWDNFRSYSRQNLLSANSKPSPRRRAPPPQPLVRSHNTLRPAPSPPPRNVSPPPAPVLPAPPAAAAAAAHNLDTPLNSNKKKSCSKLPAKNSRRNFDSPSTSNVNVSEPPAVEEHAAAAQLFDFLRENVYSEVTALISVNESHPDFLIQLFRELQLVSSEPLRQRVLALVRGAARTEPEPVTSSSPDPPAEPAAPDVGDAVLCFLLLKRDEVCSPDLLDALCSVVLNSASGRPNVPRKRLMERLAKFEGARVGDVSGELADAVGVGGQADAATQHEDAGLQDAACGFQWPGPQERQEQDELAEADQPQPRRAEPPPHAAPSAPPAPPAAPAPPAGEATPTEAEAEWLGLDRVPTRLHMEETSESQKDK